jgi:formylglycine-generating enzyme required for sulfatase activity/poly(3-hydroxybutyrate) depolymerase
MPAPSRPLLGGCGLALVAMTACGSVARAPQPEGATAGVDGAADAPLASPRDAMDAPADVLAPRDAAAPDGVAGAAGGGAPDGAAGAGGNNDAGTGGAASLPGASPGCGKPWAGKTGQWTTQPAGCNPAVNYRGTDACQTIPPGSTVPTIPTEGSPEHRGWWVYVPLGYDPSKPYTVIFSGGGCSPTPFPPGSNGFPYDTVDNGQAILVGLGVDSFSPKLGCFDTSATSNDLQFFPWLKAYIEGELCVDTRREFFSGFDDGAALAQSLSCAFPDDLRGSVTVAGWEPGCANGGEVPGDSLPACVSKPTAALFVHDVSDPVNSYACIQSSCARTLRKNGCAATTCDPTDKVHTTPFPLPANVLPPAGAMIPAADPVCVKFDGCPADDPVVLCTTTNQGHADGRTWGVTQLFWDFMSGLQPAPSLCPAGQAYKNGKCTPCAAGQSVCGGVCVDEQGDDENCGACGVTCTTTGQSCRAGACACPAGDKVCGGACVNEQTDPHNCGACGTTCPITAPACVAGTCTCATGTLCEGRCVDEQTASHDCGACGVTCGGATPFCEKGVCTSNPPSCAPGGAGMTNCGPGGSGSESCCTSLLVSGGTFFRMYDFQLGPDAAPTNETYPATLSDFRLDKYLVTVGRFRPFLAAWNGGWRPPAGAGKHTHLNGGQGLADVGVTSTGYEPGWVAADTDQVALTEANLTFDPNFSTWTPAPGLDENLPMNEVSWSEAYAFCIWDGGFLPTFTEMEYAAAGGDQQRFFPWGSKDPANDPSYAVYNCDYPRGVGFCTTDVTNIGPVGSPTLGAGRWGQLDLSGDVYELLLDSDSVYPRFIEPCVDCADLSAFKGSSGGNFNGQDASELVAVTAGAGGDASSRSYGTGFRCARSP